MTRYPAWVRATRLRPAFVLLAASLPTLALEACGRSTSSSSAKAAARSSPTDAAAGAITAGGWLVTVTKCSGCTSGSREASYRVPAGGAITAFCTDPTASNAITKLTVAVAARGVRRSATVGVTFVHDGRVFYSYHSPWDDAPNAVSTYFVKGGSLPGGSGRSRPR